MAGGLRRGDARPRDRSEADRSRNLRPDAAAPRRAEKEGRRMNARTSTAREASRHALFRRSHVPDGRALTQRLRHASWVAVIALMTAMAASVADAAVKPRTILILPFV